MLKCFKPTWMVRSIYSITPAQCQQRGIRAIITDLDNTLIAWNQSEATNEAVDWFEGMKEAGVAVLILSNNSKNRVAQVADALNAPYISRAMKPLKKGYKQAQEALALPKEELLMVGDQLMTDIFGANRFGIRSVFVEPILTSDAWVTKFNRTLERYVLNHLQRNQGLRWEDSMDESIQS